MEEFNKIYDQWVDAKIAELEQILKAQDKKNTELKKSIEELLKSFTS